MVEQFYVKLGDPSCSDYWDIFRGKQNKHTNADENRTYPLDCRRRASDPANMSSAKCSDVTAGTMTTSFREWQLTKVTLEINTGVPTEAPCGFNESRLSTSGSPNAQRNKSPLPLTDPRDAVPHARRAVYRCGRSVSQTGDWRPSSVYHTDRPPKLTAPGTIDVQLRNFPSLALYDVLLNPRITQA